MKKGERKHEELGRIYIPEITKASKVNKDEWDTSQDLRLIPFFVAQIIGFLPYDRDIITSDLSTCKLKKH